MRISKQHIAQLIHKTTAGLLCVILILASFCPITAIADDAASNESLFPEEVVRILYPDAENSYVNKVVTFRDFVKENMIAVFGLAGLIILILGLMLHRMSINGKNWQQHWRKQRRKKKMRIG